MKISPSILACDFANLENEIKKVEKYSDYLHIDVMDGNFVPNISFGYDITKCISNITILPLDVHLMVKKPLDFIKQFIELGANIITVHYETINKKELEEILEIIKDSNNDIKLGISINPDTPYEVLIPYLQYIDLILVMSVYPGFYGQEFINDIVYKIDRLSEIIKQEKLNILLEVDGGINDITIENVKNCDIVVSGSYIFKSNDIQNAIKKLKK